MFDAASSELSSLHEHICRRPDGEFRSRCITALTHMDAARDTLDDVMGKLPETESRPRFRVPDDGRVLVPEPLVYSHQGRAVLAEFETTSRYCVNELSALEDGLERFALSVSSRDDIELEHLAALAAHACLEMAAAQLVEALELCDIDQREALAIVGDVEGCIDVATAWCNAAFSRMVDDQVRQVCQLDASLYEAQAASKLKKTQISDQNRKNGEGLKNRPAPVAAAIKKAWDRLALTNSIDDAGFAGMVAAQAKCTYQYVNRLASAGNWRSSATTKPKL